jgi:hypothetical protein
MQREAAARIRTNSVHDGQQSGGQTWHAYCYRRLDGNGLAFAGLKVPQIQ